MALNVLLKAALTQRSLLQGDQVVGIDSLNDYWAKSRVSDAAS